MNQFLFKDGKCQPDVAMKMFIDIIRTKALSRFSSTVGVLGMQITIIILHNYLY